MTTILACALLAALGAGCLVLAGSHAWRRHLGSLQDAAVPAPAPRSAAGPHPPRPRVLGYLESRMRAAGVDWPTAHVLGLMASGGLAAAAAAYLSTGIPWLATLALSAGYLVPVWRLNALAQTRAAKVAEQLDGVCGQLVQALSGGMSLADALRQQAERAPDPTGAELRRIVQRQRFGEDLAVLLTEFGQRIDLDEARLLAAGLRLTQEQGARPRAVLESVQRALRDRREWQGLVGELSAQTRSHAAILTAVPLILFPIMRWVAPGFTAPLFATPAGQVLVAADLAWLLGGLQLVSRWMAGVQG